MKKRKLKESSKKITAGARILKWWRRLRRCVPSNCIDPITQCNLYDEETSGPIFRVVEENGSTVTGYDAHELRRYFLASGEIRFPVNKREINIAEARRLDRCTGKSDIESDSMVNMLRNGGMKRKRAMEQEYREIITGFEECVDECVKVLYVDNPFDLLTCIHAEESFQVEIDEVVSEWILPLVVNSEPRCRSLVNDMLNSLSKCVDKFEKGYSDSEHPDDEDIMWVSVVSRQNLPPPKLCKLASSSVGMILSTLKKCIG